MTDEMQELLSRIEELLLQKDYITLRSTLTELQEADIAALIGELPENNIPIVFRLLPKEIAAECFAYLEADVQETLINVFSDRELWNVISGLFVDIWSIYLRKCPRTSSSGSSKIRRMKSGKRSI